MKNALKLILLALFTFTSISAIGQSMLVKGGLSLASVSGKDDAGNYNDFFKSKIGVHLGVAYEQEISDILFLEVGPMLNMKGANVEFLGIDAGSINTIYIDVPILFKGYFEINDDILIYGAAGPYLGLGLVGNQKDGDGDKEDFNWGSNDTDNFKRLDFGLSFGAGVDLNGIQVGLAFDPGLFNISSYTDEGTKITNNVFRITAGYRLSK